MAVRIPAPLRVRDQLTVGPGVLGQAAAWSEARRKTARRLIGITVFATLSSPLMAAAALKTAEDLGPAQHRYVSFMATLLLFSLPGVTVMVGSTQRDRTRNDELVNDLATKLLEALSTATREASDREVQSDRQRFERRVANALEMADGEADVIDVVQRALITTAPHSRSELLLADNSHAHLVRMAVASVDGEAPGCGVDSPDNCPAARRAQTQHFADSDALDACPRLRDRGTGRCSAVCVPVSVMGRTVGVLHSTGEPDDEVSGLQVQDLEMLANLTGARIGLMRVMAETQLQASTDNLTGLANRRAFERAFGAQRAEASEIAVAMADLDHFKQLNDTYGHDSGDRALRLFSQVARDSLRVGDLIGRHGGEEFVVAMPNCSATAAVKALDALRDRLDAAITVAGLPKFTVSFGLVLAGLHEGLPDVLARADVALFEAKRAGRDRVVTG